MTRVTRLVLVRHAESMATVRRIVGGPRSCTGLSELGRRQAEALRDRLARTGEVRYRQRLEGKFTASAVAGDGKVYVTNEDGTTFVLRAGPKFELLSRNELKEYTLASPAIAGGRLFLRTEHHLYCIGRGAD